MFVGVCRVSLHLRGNNSLKGKRKVVRSILDRTRTKFNASVAEVQENDNKRRAVIGVAVVGNSAKHVDSMLGRILSFIESVGYNQPVRFVPARGHGPDNIPLIPGAVMNGVVGDDNDMPVLYNGPEMWNCAEYWTWNVANTLWLMSEIQSIVD